MTVSECICMVLECRMRFTSRGRNSEERRGRLYLSIILPFDIGLSFQFLIYLISPGYVYRWKINVSWNAAYIMYQECSESHRRTSYMWSVSWRSDIYDDIISQEMYYSFCLENTAFNWHDLTICQTIVEPLYNNGYHMIFAIQEMLAQIVLLDTCKWQKRVNLKKWCRYSVATSRYWNCTI